MKRLVLGVVAVALIAALALFEPWTLWTSSTVNEAIEVSAPVTSGPITSGPSASASPEEPETPSPPTAPVEQARGTFVSQEHGTSGRARILEAPDGTRTLRLENFSTTNGPDLHVWLSDREAGGDWFKYAKGRSVKLGELKANNGNHNYAIPADASIDEIKSVVIWCKRFRVAFGSAPLAL